MTVSQTVCGTAYFCTSTYRRCVPCNRGIWHTAPDLARSSAAAAVSSWSVSSTGSRNPPVPGNADTKNSPLSSHAAHQKYRVRSCAYCSRLGIAVGIRFLRKAIKSRNPHVSEGFTTNIAPVQPPAAAGGFDRFLRYSKLNIPVSCPSENWNVSA